MEKQLVWCIKRPKACPLHNITEKTLYYYKEGEVNEFLYDIKTEKEMYWGVKGSLDKCIIKLLTAEEAIEILLEELKGDRGLGYRSFTLPIALCENCKNNSDTSTIRYIKFGDKYILEITPRGSYILANGIYKYIIESLCITIISDDKLNDRSFVANLFPEDIRELARMINFICY